MALSSFMPSTTGLEAYSHALETVADNFANLRTVGYRSAETMFYTLLGSAPVVKNVNSGIASSRADIQGVGYYDRVNILDPGVIYNTGDFYDVAISGNENAFFQLKDSGGKLFYSRAGNFSTRTENGITYLVNGNGLKVQGFPATDGKAVFGQTPGDIVLQYPEVLPPHPTTEMSITANVPATGVDSSSYTLTVYGAKHDGANVNMQFTKVEGKINTWAVSFSTADGTVTAPETEVVFSDNGELLSPKSLNVSVAWDDGDTANFALDISKMTQFAGDSSITDISQDGAPSGQYQYSTIDRNGVFKAYYTNGDTYNIAQLALVGFTAPENLVPASGTLFEAYADAGNSSYVNPNNMFAPQSLEASSVNAEEEFSKLIVVQRAYSLNTQTFTANNEMLELLIDLKT